MAPCVVGYKGTFSSESHTLLACMHMCISQHSQCIGFSWIPWRKHCWISLKSDSIANHIKKKLNSSNDIAFWSRTKVITWKPSAEMLAKMDRCPMQMTYFELFSASCRSMDNQHSGGIENIFTLYFIYEI